MVFCFAAVRLAQSKFRDNLSIPNYIWEKVVPSSSFIRSSKRVLKGINASVMLGKQPLYLSITSISSRIDQVNSTIWTLLSGTVIPDHIFLFLSESPYLLDEGIPRNTLPPSLLYLSANYPFSIIYTDNIGPHRKLLPLLARKWKEDCVIITFDDDFKKGVENYVMYNLRSYLASNMSSVVSFRARRIGFCNTPPLFKLLSYNLWHGSGPATQEMLLLPMGMGSILYRPRFFHPVVFNEVFLNATRTADDIMFRFATLVNKVPVVISSTNRQRFYRYKMAGTSNFSIVSSPSDVLKVSVPLPAYWLGGASGYFF